MSIQEKLQELKLEFENGLPKVPSMEELLSFKSKFLGKSGALSEVLKGLKDVSPADRPKIGGLANQLRDLFDQAVAEKLR